MRFIDINKMRDDDDGRDLNRNNEKHDKKKNNTTIYEI